MSESITVTGLVLHGHHGVGADERRRGQNFLIDLVLHLSIDTAARTDSIADTIDYGEAIAVASRAFTAQQRHLIEAAAGDVAAALLDGFATLERVEVTVHKPMAPIPATFADIAVKLIRARAEV